MSPMGVFEPLTPLEKLAAAADQPRALPRLAPNAAWRARVVSYGTPPGEAPVAASVSANVNADPPAQCGPVVVEALANACDTHGFRYDRMISRAYHDSLFMSRIAPTAMLFIPCRGGVSHRPDEYSSPEAIAQGTLVLAEALARLAA